jgi:hypothetical protein
MHDDGEAVGKGDTHLLETSAIGDLHGPCLQGNGLAAPGQDRVRRFVEQLAHCTFALLGDLRARDGVYEIPGNHEYFFDYASWMRKFADLGFRLLPKQHAVLRRAGAELVMAGVTDLSAANHGQAAPDLDAALADVPAGTSFILLDHKPQGARKAAGRGVALQLSEHTHGGMVVGLDRVVARANAGFVSGRYDVDGMTLYVSNGTALWPGFALRLGKPSELTRITLRRR